MGAFWMEESWIGEEMFGGDIRSAPEDFDRHRVNGIQ